MEPRGRGGRGRGTGRGPPPPYSGRGRGDPRGAEYGGAPGPRGGKRPLSPRSRGLDDEARDAGFAGIHDPAWRRLKRAEIDEMTLEESGLWEASPPPSPEGAAGGITRDAADEGEGSPVVSVPGGQPTGPAPEGGGGGHVTRLRAELERHLREPPTDPLGDQGSPGAPS